MSSLIIDTKINASKVVKGAKEITHALASVGSKAASTAKKVEKAQFALMKMAGQKVMGALSAMGGMLLKLFVSLSAAIALALVASLKTGIKNLAQFNDGLNPTNESLTNIRTELLRMKNAVAAAFEPILTLVAPALTRMISLLADAITKIGMLFAALRGQSTFTKAVAVTDDYAKSLKKTGAAAKKAKNQLAGIYDLNNISRNQDSGSGGGSELDPNKMFEVTEIDSGISMVADKIKSFVDSSKEKISELWNKFKENWFVQDMIGRFETIKETFGNFITNLKDKWAGFVENLQSRKDTIGKIWDAILKVVQLFAIKWQFIIQIVIGAMAPFAEAVGNIITHIIDILGGLVDFIAGVFTGDWERAWNGIKEIFRGLWNALLDIFEGVINMIIGGLNAINVDVPDWIPLIGGKHFGFQFEEKHFPRAATGTVIPRQSREFPVIVGDNNRETEVISPLSTIKQALKEALQESKIGGNTVVRVVLEGDAAGVFRLVRQEEEANYNETGNLAFVH